jgi:hypothetical protein
MVVLRRRGVHSSREGASGQSDPSRVTGPLKPRNLVALDVSEIADYSGKGLPVIDIINGINSDRITARVATDFYDIGLAAGKYLTTLQPAIQSIGRNCSDNKSLRNIFRDALGDLALLGREVLITPGLAASIMRQRRLVFAALHESGSGPSEKCRHAPLRSVQWGIADWICSR